MFAFQIRIMPVNCANSSCCTAFWVFGFNYLHSFPKIKKFLSREFSKLKQTMRKFSSLGFFFVLRITRRKFLIQKGLRSSSKTASIKIKFISVEGKFNQQTKAQGKNSVNKLCYAKGKFHRNLMKILFVFTLKFTQ